MSLQSTLRTGFVLYSIPLFAANARAATILTFENAADTALNASDHSSPYFYGGNGPAVGVDPRYGVDVTSATQVESNRDVPFQYGTTDGIYTPNIAVAYNQAIDIDYANPDSQPGMPNPFVFLARNTGTMTFTADAGHFVDLQSFQVGALPNSSFPLTVTVTDQTNTTLYSYTGTLATGSPVTFGVGSPSNPVLDPFLGAVGTQLTLTVTGNAGFTGVDNVIFGQDTLPAPEPSTVVLAITGGLGLLVTRSGRRMASVWLNRQKCC